MKICYCKGPDKIKLGEYLFEKNVFQEVPDDVALVLLGKESVKFEKEKVFDFTELIPKHNIRRKK